MQAVVDFYGPTDLGAMYVASPATSESIRLLLGGSPDEVPGRSQAASPSQHVSPGTPPMLLIYGAADHLIPTSQAETMALALDRAGVAHRLIVVAGAPHGFGFRVHEHRFASEILAFLSDIWKDKRKNP